MDDNHPQEEPTTEITDSTHPLSDADISNPEVDTLDSEDADSRIYQEYRDMRDQIEEFQRLANNEQRIAITLPDFPYFTETALQSIFFYEYGTVVIKGQTKGNKQMLIRTHIKNFSFALSLISSHARIGLVDVGYISGR